MFNKYLCILLFLFVGCAPTLVHGIIIGKSKQGHTHIRYADPKGRHWTTTSDKDCGEVGDLVHWDWDLKDAPVINDGPSNEPPWTGFIPIE